MKKKLSKLTALLLSLTLALSIVPVWADSPSVSVYLDGHFLSHTDARPYILNDRTMVPIYQLAQALGCDVGWDGATKTVTLTRAGDTVKMVIDDPTAYVNGKPVAMDVAPTIMEDRTMIPAAYVAAFFGQKVEWDGETRRVYITEDKSVAEGSNLEAWALPMGSMLAQLDHGKPDCFGLYARSVAGIGLSNKLPYAECRKILSSSWSIKNRDDLIGTVISMTFSGHNDNFRGMAADVKLRSQAEREAISAASSVWPLYMWEYTEYVDEKWGDRGILCWDLFRMSNLVQWGYTAGYITYEEALALIEPAATLLCENFSSWEEAYENYLDGYNWWARNDVLGKDIWQTSRGKTYQTIKQNYGSIFQDSLFETGVIPLPGLSVEDVIATLPS
jgi:hypothetical protein